MAADGCISAHHQKMREQLGEKMGGCARGSGREGTMAWKVRDTGGAWWDVKEETTVWWWVRRQVMDETEVGWGENWKRGRTRESNCAVLDTSTENTLASCQSDRLAWLIFSSFQSAFHYASLSPFRMCPDANFQWVFFSLYTFFMLHVRTKQSLSHRLS